MNFDKNIEAAQKINNFVKNKTNDKIKDLVKGDCINNKTSVILVNANYFKGDWLYKFDKTLTEVDDFYISETKTVSAAFMHVTSNFNSKEFDDLDATSLELKYTNSKLSFVIVLPHKREGLSKLEGKLSNYNLTKLAGDFSPYDRGYEVILPKFKVEFEIELYDILKNLGMKEMFNEEKANLSGLLESKEQLYVSDVLHKANIEINEEGAEAASATSLHILIPMSADKHPPRIPKFKVDHPFLYYIWDTQTQTPVFSGRITKPNVVDHTDKKSCTFFGLIC
ncbi:antichymotrypsin-2-like [Contarinia nasturtii]|uniref:antichymotrypsin-2-like n=1 Tax=Contarinia nasturtii TaxID=265458 RepID=UPI0012D4531F|nr:antichymotrypsin-2-like [Contarinia nasturtii]